MKKNMTFYDSPRLRAPPFEQFMNKSRPSILRRLMAEDRFGRFSQRVQWPGGMKGGALGLSDWASHLGSGHGI